MRRTSITFSRTSIAPVLLAVTLTTPPLTAQAVTGRVLDVDGDSAVAGVSVSLVDSADVALATVVTDSAGLFAIPVAAAGRYRLRTNHIAFRSVTTQPLTVRPGETVDVDIRLSRTAIALDPLVVRARHKVNLVYLRDYYARVKENRTMGRGRILTREDLKPLEGLAVVEAIRRQMLPFKGPQGFDCKPTYYWNGMAMDEAAVKEIPVSNVEGIEIYRRYNAPPKYPGNYCGVILVWSRPLRPGEGHPFNWVILAGGLAVFVLLSTVF